MRYIWEVGKNRRVTMQPICGIKLGFNRSINAPFCLGRRVCKKCLRLWSSHLTTKSGGG